MNNKTWLIVDGTFISHLAYYAIGHLKDDLSQLVTGVTYGFFRYLRSYIITFNTNDVLLCFDKGKSLRYGIYPDYKKGHSERSQLKALISDLKYRYLNDVGFQVHEQDGYEADDVVAHYAQNLSGTKIIVSEDKDYYQLLTKEVSLFKPRSGKVYTRRDFYNEFLINPWQWKDVKAIAGCTSDCVEGIPGVGEKLAVKFVRGILEPHTKAYQKIIANKAIIQRNLNLVDLPYPGLSLRLPHENKVTLEKWQRFAQKMKMKTLINKPPLIETEGLFNG